MKSRIVAVAVSPDSNKYVVRVHRIGNKSTVRTYTCNYSDNRIYSFAYWAGILNMLLQNNIIRSRRRNLQ